MTVENLGRNARTASWTRLLTVGEATDAGVCTEAGVRAGRRRWAGVRVEDRTGV
jgi:hypothetical protein